MRRRRGPTRAKAFPLRLLSLSREGGQAMVEFLVILPIFLILAFGLIEFGTGLHYWINMTHLANEGARYASVNRWPGCPANDTAACPQSLKAYLRARAVTEELASGGTDNVPAGMQIKICYPEGGSAIGQAVRVTISTDYTLAIVDRLFGAVNKVGVIDLSASATMRLERTPTPLRLGAEVTNPC